MKIDNEWDYLNFANSRYLGAKHLVPNPVYKDCFFLRCLWQATLPIYCSLWLKV